MTRPLTYNPSVFGTPDIDAAKRVILTPTRDRGTEARWESETPYLAELIAGQLGDLSGRLVLDYGCGIGRVAKALIERAGCVVLGVDMSTEMRGLAPGYVDASEFSVISRRVLQALVRGGLRVDAAICVWVLQHCIDPAEDLDLMLGALPAGRPLFVVNTTLRAVPTVEKPWINDGVDVAALVAGRCDERAGGRLDPTCVGEAAADAAWWAAYAVR